MSYARPAIMVAAPRRRGLLGLLERRRAGGALGDPSYPDAPGGFFNDYDAMVFAAASALAYERAHPVFTPNEGASQEDVDALVAAAKQGVYVANSAGTSDQVEAAYRAHQVAENFATTGSFYRDPATGATVANEAGLAALRAAARKDVQALVDNAVAGGAVFTDTILPGALYDASFLEGMISTTELVDDMVNLQFSGEATHTAAAAGTIPAAVVAHVVTPETLVHPTTGDPIDPGDVIVDYTSRPVFDGDSLRSALPYALGAAAGLYLLTRTRSRRRR